MLLWLFNVCAGLNAREVGDRLDAREMLNSVFVCLSDVCEGLGAPYKKSVFVRLFNVWGGLGAQEILHSVFLWLFNVCVCVCVQG